MLLIGVFAIWFSERLMGIRSSGPTCGRSRERDAGESVETSVVLHLRLKRLRCENAVLKHECKMELEFPRFRGRLWAFRFQPVSGGPFVIDG